MELLLVTVLQRFKNKIKLWMPKKAKDGKQNSK